MPRRFTLLTPTVFACLVGVASAVPTTAQWQGTTDTNWFTNSNWSTASTPSNVRASVATSGTINTTGAASNVNVAGLDISNSGSQLLFDFSSSGYSVNLGATTSTWSGGLVELRNAYGVFGNGAGNSTLSIGSGVELLYSTNNLTRYLNSLTIGNAGTIHNTTGTLSINYSTLTNQSGGLIHADGAEIDFGSSTTLDNSLGTIQATGAAGKLFFYNTLTTASLGSVALVNGGQAYLDGTVDNTSATLNAPTGGSFLLWGGTIKNGSIATGAVTFTNYGGYLDGATYGGDVSLPNSAYVRLINGATFSGGNATLGNYSSLQWSQIGTLSGKNLSFGAGSNLYVYGVNSALTLDPTTTASGQIQIDSDSSSGTAITNQGTINHNSTTGGGYLYASTFTNSGTITNTAANTWLQIGTTSNGYNTINTGNITVNGSSSTIYLDGNVDNTGGTLTATNGQFIFRGTNTSAHLNGGTLNIASGAHAYLNGTITNGNTTLNAPASGSYELYGGTVSGGTVASGALAFTNYGGYLDGATYTGDITLPSSAYVRLINGASFTGGNVTFGNSSSLYWQQSGTLSGKTLTFGNSSNLYVNGGNYTLTLDPTTTATGQLQIYNDGASAGSITNQGTLTHTAASTGGYLYATNFYNSGTITNTATNAWLQVGVTWSGYNSINTGNITVNGSGSTIYLDGNVDNTGGTLTATNGQFIFRGTNTSAHLNGGTLNIASGAHAYLNGTITNGNATLNAPTSGTYELYGGTVSGGTVASGALAFTNYGGYLDGATYTGDITLPSNAYVRLTNGANFTGANVTFGNSSALDWNQSGTLTAKNLTFGQGSDLYVYGGNSTLTLDSATTATGQIQIYSDGSTGTAITNQGTITNNTSNTGGYLYATNFTNSGTITNTGSSNWLQVGVTWSGYNTANTGNITVNGTGATIYLDGNVDNTGGTLTATNGQFIFRGNNTSAHLNGGTLNIASGAHAYLNGTIANGNATLSPPTSGVYELYGGTISGGTIAPGALGFTNYGGYLDAATLNDDLNLPASTSVRLVNGATSTGGNVAIGNSATLYWQQAGALTGKTLSLGTNSTFYVIGANDTLTLSSTTTGTGDINIYSDGSSGSAITNQGTLTHNSTSSGYMYAPTLNNSGTITNTSANTALYLGSTYNGYSTTNTGNITVNGSGASIYLDGNVDNTGGTLTATNGQLIFRGSNTTAHLNGGTVKIASGAHAYLNGVLDNTLATLAAPASGIYELWGGTITGGTIAPGTLSYTNYGGYLDGATVNDDLTLPASTYVHLVHNASFTGGNVTFGSNSTIYWQQAGTLTGKTLNFGPSSSLYVAGSNNTLTLDATTTATGALQIYTDGSTGTAITNQGTLTHSIANTGYLYAPNFTNSGSISNIAANTSLFIGSTYGYNTINTGNITVNGAGANIYLDGNVDNTGGTLTATNGQFILRGTNTTAHLNGGTVNIAAAGHVYLNGTLTNTGTTLNAPASGSYEIYGGTINGGSVAAGALTFTNYAGTLNGVTLLGNVTFPNSSYSYFTGGTNLGTANSTLTLGSSAGVYWQQSGTWVSNAATFGSGAYVYISGTNNGLTLDANSSANGDVQIYADGSTGTTLTNQGTITHTTGSGYLYAQTLTNSGSIMASGGTLTLGSSSTGATIANTGLLRVAGGNLYLQTPSATPFVNQGTIDIKSGTFFTNNNLNNGVTGVIQGAGIISGNLTFSGGTIAPGNNGIGTLTFSSGTLTVASAGTLAIDLGGTTADELVFQNPASTVNIGSGLLTLSLNLLSAPTANTTFNLVAITYGTNTISGSFAGLLNSGDTLSANFGGNAYTFAINYQPNLVSLSYTPIMVPEPSEYALMTLGLVALAAVYHRRRRR